MISTFDERRILTMFDSPLTRAALLQRAGGVALAATGLATLASACGGSDGPSGTVAFLGWQGYDDNAAAKPVLDQGVELATTYITNNDEILTKLRGGGIGQIDVVTPYFGYIEPMIAAEMLQPLDYSKLPSTDGYFENFVNPSWNTKDGEVYSAPLVWADTPMVYSKDMVSELPKSYEDLKDSVYKGKLTTLDDPLGNIILFSKALFGGAAPTKITKSQLEEVGTLLKEVRPNMVSVAASFGDILDLLTRGEAGLCVAGWRFLQVQAAQKGETLDVHTPESGSFSWCDNYCIPNEAPNPDATYAFIDTMISASGNAIVAGNTGSAVTNSDAQANLAEDQRDLYPYDDIQGYFDLNGLYGLPPLEPEGDLATFQDWQAEWQKFKSA